MFASWTSDKEETIEIPDNFEGLDLHQFEFGGPEAQSALEEWLKTQPLPFAWDGNPTENKIAASIAYLLRQKEIPCFLWGLWAASLLGEHKKPFEIDIVVPDKFVKVAIQVLEEKGIFGKACFKAWAPNDDNALEQGVCPHGELLPLRPFADAHFDFYRSASDGNGSTEIPCLIQIYAKSKIAWELPDPPLTMTKDDPSYIASNSPWLPFEQKMGPAGRWLHYPSVPVPRPEKFVETLIYLLCRDWKNANAYDVYWRQLLHTMREVRENPDAVVVKDMHDSFGQFWDLYNSGSPQRANIWRFLATLRVELKALNKGPPPPKFNFFGTEEKAIENHREI